MSEVRIKVVLDGEESVLTLNQINQQISDLSEKAEGLDATSDEFQKINDQIKTLKDALESGITLTVNDEEAVQKLDSVTQQTEVLNDTPVDIDVTADTTQATDNITNLDNQLNEVGDGGVINLDVNADKEKIDDLINSLKEGKKIGDDLGETDVTPKIDTDEVNNSIVKTNNSVASLRKELIDLTAEFEGTEVGSDRYNELENKIGDVSVKLAIAKDRTEDLTDALNLNVGSGVERANNSFRLLADGIKNLDFGKISTSLKGLGNVIKDSFVGPLKTITTGFGDLGKGAKSLDLNGLKTGLGGVTSGFGSLGKAIIGTGIGALVVGITSLIANFDDLKNSGGLVGKIFTAIGDSIDFLVDKFRPLLSFLGLVGTESDVKAEKVAEANKVEQEAIEKRYEREIELAKAAGKETTQLQKDRLAALQKLTESEIALLNEIQVKQGELNSDQKERLKELTDAAEELAFQTQLVDAEAAKEREDKQKEADEKAKERRQKQLEEEKKYRDTIRNLEEKYIEDGVKQIQIKYQKELDLIKGNSIQEEALRQKIIAKRDVEISKLNEKLLSDQRKLNFELLTLQIQNEEAQLLLTAETEEEKIQIQKNADQELFELRLQNLEEEKNAAITAVGVTAEQKKLIEAKYISDVNKLNADAAKLREEEIKKQNDLVISSTQAQADAIKKERDAILSDSIEGVGIFGRLDLLDANLKKERDLIIKQRDALLKIQRDIVNSDTSTADEKKAAQDEILRLNKEYQDKLTDQENTGAEDRKDIISKEVQLRVEQAQELSNVAFDLVGANLESQQSALDTEAQLLENQYQARRVNIEKNITDEKMRTDALAALDSDLNNARTKIEEKNLALKKKAIKNERNQTLVNILLSTADAIAKATAAADKTNPISFAISLAANIVGALAAIKKAKDALKAADAAAGAIGGGGASPSTPSPSVAIPQQSVTNPLIPTTNVAGGTNPVFNGTQFGSPSQGQNNPVVSVVEINRVQRSVSVSESSNTINGG